VEEELGEGSIKALEDALQLERMGIALLPIHPVYKNPHYRLLPKNPETDKYVWAQFRETPPTPPEIIAWFRKARNCNIAIITGQPSRLAVLDIDGPTPPDLPELPDTVVEKTPRKEGGYHYYFRVDSPQGSHNYNWNEDGVSYHCEIKADLVYVICSPSSFSGKHYEWRPGRSLFEREPAPLPPELVPYLDGKGGKATY